MHGPLNVKLSRLFIFRKLCHSIFRLVEETKFMSTVAFYGTFWFHLNKLAVLKRTGVMTTLKLRHFKSHFDKHIFIQK